MAKSQFEFSPPSKIAFAWVFAGVLLFAFASLPWVAALRSERAGSVIAFTLITAWSLPPFWLGIALMVNALCRVRLVAKSGSVCRLPRLFKWKTCVKIQIDRVYFVTYRRYQHRRIDEQLTVFIRSGRKTSILANEQTCGRIEELFDWLRSSTNTKCLDLRNRGATGINSRFLTRGIAK